MRHRWTPAWRKSSQKAVDVANQQEELGLPACLLVPDAIRNSLAKLLRVAPRLQCSRTAKSRDAHHPHRPDS